jgi:predicted metal-binding protein
MEEVKQIKLECVRLSAEVVGTDAETIVKEAEVLYSFIVNG